MAGIAGHFFLNLFPLIAVFPLLPDYSMDSAN